MGRDLNSRSPVCETGIITRLDYPSNFCRKATHHTFSYNAAVYFNIFHTTYTHQFFKVDFSTTVNQSCRAKCLDQNPSSISVALVLADQYILPSNGALPQL